MRTIRAVLAILGAAVFAAGVAAIHTPETVAILPVDDAVAWLGNDYLLVTILGGIGAVATIGVLARQSVRGIDQATPPAPEQPPTGRRPGAGFDETVDAWRGLALSFRPRRRERVRERLFRAAVVALTRTTGCSHEEARERVERGAWTEDREAAAFLASDGGLDPIATIGAALRGEAPVSRKARRTVRAIEGLEGDDRG